MIESSILSDKEIVEIDSKWCSFGDTVHYKNPPKIFRKCDGSFVYDSQDVPYLDVQMWYSSCNLGYKNKRLNNAMIDQLETLPQLASQYLNMNKALLAEKICKANIERFNTKGRCHFNVGGAQAVDDALKLVRNYSEKNLMFAFMGGYHGRTLGASCITSSYRYRRRFGHFGDRANFVPYPYCYRCHYGKCKENCDLYCVKQFAKLFETEYNSILDFKTNESEYTAFFAEPIQGTGGYVVPPENYFKELKKVLDEHNILLVCDEVQMGLYRTGKLWSIEHFGVNPDVLIFGKSLTNGINTLSGIWAKEEMINPEVFPPGSTHSTFASNPLGTRMGLEVMNIFEETDFESKVMEKGLKFLAGLHYLKSKHKNIGDVGGLGLALRVEITESDRFTPSKDLTTKLCLEGLKGDLYHNGKKCGLVVDVGGHYKNVLTLAPSLLITDEEIELAIELLDQLFTRIEH